MHAPPARPLSARGFSSKIRTDIFSFELRLKNLRFVRLFVMRRICRIRSEYERTCRDGLWESATRVFPSTRLLRYSSENPSSLYRRRKKNNWKKGRSLLSSSALVSSLESFLSTPFAFSCCCHDFFFLKASAFSEHFFRFCTNYGCGVLLRLPYFYLFSERLLENVRAALLHNLYLHLEAPSSHPLHLFMPPMGITSTSGKRFRKFGTK